MHQTWNHFLKDGFCTFKKLLEINKKQKRKRRKSDLSRTRCAVRIAQGRRNKSPNISLPKSTPKQPEKKNRSNPNQRDNFYLSLFFISLPPLLCFEYSILFCDFLHLNGNIYFAPPLSLSQSHSHYLSLFLPFLSQVSWWQSLCLVRLLCAYSNDVASYPS